MLTQEYVKTLFTYNNGKLIRKIRTGNNANEGEIVGSVERKGYLRVAIKGKSYKVHRIVWLWHYGYLPENQLDHINRKKDDNRIENLREVSGTCNRRNSRVYYTTKSGMKGVVLLGNRTTWQAQIKLLGTYKYLGCSKCIVEAACLRLAAEQCLDWHGCDTSSEAARFVANYVSRNHL